MLRFDFSRVCCDGGVYVYDVQVRYECSEELVLGTINCHNVSWSDVCALI